MTRFWSMSYKITHSFLPVFPSILLPKMQILMLSLESKGQSLGMEGARVPEGVRIESPFSLWNHLYLIYLFLKNILFIYSEREREREAEGEAGSMQGARRGTRSWDPGVIAWAEGGAKPLSHPGCPLYLI